MTTYVFSTNPSNGARDITQALGATRLRRFDGMNFFRKGKRIQFNPDDVLVCWGSPVSEFDGPRIINSGSHFNKYTELIKLNAAGIPCPAVEQWDVVRHGNVPSGYIGRRYNHSGGNDFLDRTDRRVDYISKKLNLSEEYRLHIFDGKSIRAGVKIPREGFTPVVDEVLFASNRRLGQDVYHPWVRSFDAGWRINYDDFKSKTAQREIARRAVEALGLTFGAVDVGRDLDGIYYVLEVNRAPGADAPTVDAYARAINRWIEKSPAETTANIETEPVVAQGPSEWVGLRVEQPAFTEMWRRAAEQATRDQTTYRREQERLAQERAYSNAARAAAPPRSAYVAWGSEHVDFTLAAPSVFDEDE